MASMAERLLTVLEMDAAGVTNPPAIETRDAWELRNALWALMTTGTLGKLAEIYHASKNGDERAKNALDGIAGIVRDTHAIVIPVVRPERTRPA